jgi:molybdopterin synthase sulfur carrier subunit
LATRILFFGSLREKAGGAERTVRLPAGITTITALIDWLAEDDAELRAALTAPDVRVAIDQTLVAGHQSRIDASAEVAFMPAFSGG